MFETKTLEQAAETRAEQIRFVALAIIVGLITGTIGSFFHLAIEQLMHWPQFLEQYFQGIVLTILTIGIVMAVTVLSVFIVRKYAPEAGGSGVQEIEGAMMNLRVVRWRRVLPVKFLVGINALASGLALGREGPTIHIGASISAAMTDFFKVSDNERRGLLGAGAAAGLACAFNAPAAAVLFIIEEARSEFPYRFATYMGVIAASFFATLMTQIIGGTAPDLTMTVAKPALESLPLFILMGCLLGGLGTVLNASIMWSTGFAADMQKKVPYLYPALIGMLIGILLLILPFGATGGENLIIWLGQNHMALSALILLSIVRFFSLVGSYSAGTPGGIFAPMLALAICVGIAFGGIVETLFPDAGALPLAFGIAAMGGLFTASVRAPIVGVVLTIELTGAHTMVMPLIATCLAANLTSQWIGGRPIYGQLLDRILQNNKQ